MSKLKKALEKAKDNREFGEQTPVQKGRNQQLSLKTKLNKIDENRKEVEINYSETKVQEIDSKTLRKNKIISYFHDNEKSTQIKTLRTQLLNKLQEIGGSSLLITSANPFEGKTFTAINLGVSIAQELDRTVMLVDADLTNPANHHNDFARDFLGVTVDKGFSDYLLGEAEIPELLVNPGIPKLTILPANNYLPNSAELLGSPRMESLVNEMKHRYQKDRIIIFDSPSVLKFSDPLVLSNYVDGILIVVEEGKTTDSDLKQTFALFEGKPIIGIVLNKSRELRR